jgi:cytidylate kinase
VHLPVYREVHAPATPFITISRQVGGGAWTLAQRLVERLNHEDPGQRAWTCWDRELVGKVAADHHMSEQLIESIEDAGPSWLADFFSGLAASDPDAPSQDQVVHRMSKTIRALAQAGRVVIVGRGGVHITHDMPGGLHVRLVAPLERRIEYMAEYLKTTRPKAAEHVRHTDAAREAFHRRYWPNKPLSPESFHLTINTGIVSEERAIGCILGLVPLHVSATVSELQPQGQSHP